MGGWLAVRYEGEKIIPLDGTISLNPKVPGQHRGYFQLIWVNRSGKHIILDHYTPQKLNLTGDEPLLIKGFKTRPGMVHLELYYRGKLLENKSYSLPGNPFFPIAGAAVAAVVLLFFLPGRILPKAPMEPIQPIEPSAPVTMEEAAPPVVEKPAVPAPPPPPPRAERPEEKEEEAPAPPPAPPTPFEKGVTFLPDSPILTAHAQGVLNSIPLTTPEGTLTLLMVRGHCALWGTEEGRLRLSIERAEAVADFLIRRGALFSPKTIITGVGASMPLTRDPERQAINRRVEMKFQYQ